MTYKISFLFLFVLISCSHKPSSNYRALAYKQLRSNSKCHQVLNLLSSFANESAKADHRKIWKNSHARNFSDFNKKIAKLTSFASNYSADSMLITKLTGDNAQLAEMIDLLILRSQSFIKALDQFESSNNEALNLYILELKHRVSIKQYQLKHLDNYDHHKLRQTYTGSEVQKDLLDFFNHPYQGLIGELDYYMRLDNIVGHNFDIGKTTAIPLEISEHFKKGKQRLNVTLQKIKTQKGWSSFKSRYDMIFKRISLSNDQSREQKFNTIIKWLESKEFDLIRTISEDKWQIIEIKNYNKKMTIEMLTKKNDKGKSILDQQLEAKQILNLMELEAHFENVIIFKNGSSPEVTKKLEEHGITVLESN